MQHIIRHIKGIRKSCLLVSNSEQVLIRDNNQCINELLQFFNARIGNPHAMIAFKLEGPRDNTDRQDTKIPGRLGNNWRSTGSGSAAHSGRNETHMAPLQMRYDFFDGFFCRRRPNMRFGACTQSFCELSPQLNSIFGEILFQSLRVGIRNNEFDPLKL